jgi:hypothetical protein
MPIYLVATEFRPLDTGPRDSHCFLYTRRVDFCLEMADFYLEMEDFYLEMETGLEVPVSWI